MDTDLKGLGDRIKKARNKKNMSQADLAERLNISTSHMSDIETGKTKFSVDILMRMTEILQISADELLLTDIPVANAVYAAEITNILEGCTPAEKNAMLATLKNMKAAFMSRE